jgi:hypothetical protein
MRTAIPLISAPADALKQRLQHEHNGHTKPRLQMLYLLAAGHAQTRQEVAQWLGVHRHTLGRWLAIDAAGGLEALLRLYQPAGKRPSLAPAGLASVGQALQRPEGFASYGALRQWVRQTHGSNIQDTTLYTLVRTRFKTQLKVARPRHTKKP